jgi:hypothetical protein
VKAKLKEKLMKLMNGRFFSKNHLRKIYKMNKENIFGRFITDFTFALIYGFSEVWERTVQI